MPVGEMLCRMSSEELSEWMAYARIEPLPAQRIDYLAAMVAAVIANTARDPKAHPRPFTIKEFLPRWAASSEEREMDWEALKRRAMLITRLMGGRIIHKGQE